MAEFPDFSRRTCPTQQNPLVKQAKEEAILNSAIKQNCLTPSDFFKKKINVSSPLFSYFVFYFSYPFLKTQPSKSYLSGQPYDDKPSNV